MVVTRLANFRDIDQLVQMRWDFTVEDDESGKIKESSFGEFYQECRTFLKKALDEEKWSIWVAEYEGRVVSHMYVELVSKVPRPGRITYPFAYLTNVYTVPEHRGQGIGGKLMAAVNDWARQQKHEFIIVWPSEEGEEFYRRYGYTSVTDPMILHLT